MTAIVEQSVPSWGEYISENITNHPAWVGHISGLKADKMMRGRNRSYLYILRAGEFDQEYYVTFVGSDFTVRHVPFVISSSFEGWSYENCAPGGPFQETTIDDVIHAIMHCEKGECSPLIQF